MTKKGMSAVIVTLLLVMLSIVLVAVVWSVVNGLVSKQISSSGACFGNFEKVTLNSRYTCYNSSSSKVQISINVGDINLDGVIVSVSSAAGSQTFTIYNSSKTISDLTDYTGGTSVKLPGKNSGTTYLYSWSGTTLPDSIEIAPIINKNTCPSSDSISPISNCNLIY